MIKFSHVPVAFRKEVKDIAIALNPSIWDIPENVFIARQRIRALDYAASVWDEESTTGKDEVIAQLQLELRSALTKIKNLTFKKSAKIVVGNVDHIEGELNKLRSMIGMPGQMDAVIELREIMQDNAWMKKTLTQLHNEIEPTHNFAMKVEATDSIRYCEQTAFGNKLMLILTGKGVEKDNMEPSGLSVTSEE